MAVICRHADMDGSLVSGHMKDVGVTDALRNAFLDGYVDRRDVLEAAGTRLEEISERILRN